jgi:hypothetical protein
MSLPRFLLLSEQAARSGQVMSPPRDRLSSVYSTAGQLAGYDQAMAATRARPRSRHHQSRPGRSVVVAPRLTGLRGPAEGTIELPLWLNWSSPGHAFDLSDHDMRLWLYQTVLREATSVADLTAYLDRATLIALWPELYLPKGVRQAWEDRHAVLRAAAAA